MAKNENFSFFKEGDQHAVSNLRRVRHAISDRFHRGGVSRASAAGETVVAAAGQTSAWCTVGGGAAGTFAGFMASPVVAGVLGFVGIIQLAQSVYSNRDKAHREVTKYVWSFIDDEPPKKISKLNSKDVGGSALSLILHAQKNPPQQQEIKFKIAQSKFNDFVRELDMTEGERKRKLIDDAFGNDDGAVANYMRRLIHYGNYLQVYDLFHKIKMNDFSDLPDFGITNFEVRDTRKKLRDLGAKLQT